jgi:N-acetylglutamate synthase-like GNAT family acetyltransferase
MACSCPPPPRIAAEIFSTLKKFRIGPVSGGGLLIAGNIYDGVRGATPKDLEAVLQLIRPLEQEGVLVYRVRGFAACSPSSRLASETAAALETMGLRQASDEILKGIENFTVVEREGTLVCTTEVLLHQQAPARSWFLSAVDNAFSLGQPHLSYLARVIQIACANLTHYEDGAAEIGCIAVDPVWLTRQPF